MFGAQNLTRATGSISSISGSLDLDSEIFSRMGSISGSLDLDTHSCMSGMGSISESLNLDSPKNFNSADLNSETFVSDLLECGLKEERFRIDRKKLEDMLQGQQTLNTAESAEDFFQRVMIETSTQISWPSKLKIGAKSKKDPHVKIVGKPESVQQAKDRVLEILDTKKNRVTLKMDVSHTDHSYIIGKGGFKIQQVMEETGCHIHFPDSNRNSNAEKSNQVSIAGQAAGVELARYKIRELLPLVFVFELPDGESVNPGDENNPAISHIQQTYSFNVAFRAIGLGRTLLEVRSSQRLLSRLRQGLEVLMKYLPGSKSFPIMGFMKTEIAAQHHQFVMGPGNSNIQAIMNKTGATIIFPDSNTVFGDPTHGINRSKTTVFIRGSFDSVCLAWQSLLKCLPLVMMFDLREGQELDPVMINHFMETFSINIMLRPKTKENTKSVLLRGVEKDSKVLFQVRKEILGLDDEDSVCRPFPNGHHSDSTSPIAKMAIHPESIAHLQLHEADTDSNSTHGAAPSRMSTAESINLLSNIIQRNPQIIGLLNSLSTALPPVAANIPVVIHPTPVANVVYRRNDFNQPPFVPISTKEHVENWIKRQDDSYPYSSNALAPNIQKKNYLNADDGDSGIFMPAHNRFMRNGLESRNDRSSQLESSASSTSSNEASDKAKLFEKLSQAKEFNLQANSDVHQLLADYENKKLVANKAMQQPIGDNVRTPTQQWSGYGFSKSMPDFALRARLASQNSGSVSEYPETETLKSLDLNMASKTWSPDLSATEKKSDSPLEQVPSPFSLSNFWENIPQQPPVNYSSIRNLDQLFSLLGLEKYSDVFLHHEIDFSMFLSLTDMDLIQLNISYGARRRMLAAISAIREQRSGDWSKNFHAAPGAERRTAFTRQSTSNSLTDES